VRHAGFRQGDSRRMTAHDIGVILPLCRILKDDNWNVVGLSSIVTYVDRKFLCGS
jgi:hypothetical protein